MFTRKVAAALAAGCAVLVKPSSRTPLTALALCHLAQVAGVPDGVLQAVTGKSSEISRLLCQHPKIRKLSFTGSTEVGRKIVEQSAWHVQKLSLELGGNAPFIVCSDADLSKALESVIAAKFRNCGQTCICVNRLYVHTAIHDEFIGMLAHAIQNLTVGYGWEPESRLGPLIDRHALESVEQLVNRAVANGASVVCGARRKEVGSEGSWYEPTLLINCRADTQRFEDDDEALRMANDCPHGLAAYICTENIRRATRFGEKLECGIVGLNTGSVSSARMPFGGIKYSGFGVEGSKHGLDEYTHLKCICMDFS